MVTFSESTGNSKISQSFPNYVDIQIHDIFIREHAICPFSLFRLESDRLDNLLPF